MCVGATWMERVEAGCLSLPQNSAILVSSFPLGSSARGLSPRACCPLSPLPFPILRLPSLPSGSFRDPGLRARNSGVSASSFLLFPQTLGSRSPRPFGYPCTFRIFGGWFHSSYSSVGWGCGAQERERWCVERQDLMGKTPIYKSLRSARTESRTPTSIKADRVTPFVSGISALRKLLDKTMSKPWIDTTKE